MSITFRCEHCHKQARAPDSAGGKRGKCPHCGQHSYVPAPVSEDEIIPLAPIDAKDERRRREKIEELRSIERNLIAETGGQPPVPLEHREDLTSKDVEHFVVNYCLDLVSGQLERAEQQVAKLKTFRNPGLQAVDDFIAGKTLEPVLDEIPRRVLQGFLKQLRDKLK